MALPNTYKQVEYIQSSGTQYIKTNIIPSNTKWIYMRLSSQDTATDLLYIWSRKASDTRFWIWNSSWDNAKRVYLWWNSNDRWTISQDVTFEVKLNYLNDRKKQVDNSVIVSNIWTLSSSNDVPIYIFAWNDNYSTDPSLYAPSKIKLYSCKISDWSNIIADFVPVIRKSDNKPWLYDLVNDAFYTNQWTGEFIAWPESWELPSEYQEVEWIWASGSQYINTWYVVNTNTSRIYTKFEPQNVSTSQGSSTFQNPLFWTRTSDYNYETCLWASPSNQTYSVWLSMNWCTQAQATPADSFPKYPLWTVIELDYWKTWWTYNSFSFTWNAQYQWVTPNLLIFWIWSQGSVDARKFFWKLYSFKIWEWSNEVCNFVPCYRKSDGVIWLYDTDRDVFYTNAWSWTFTKWPDIEFYKKITHIYLGANLIRPAPSEITEEFTVPNPWTAWWILIAKSWYKITKIVAEWESYTTNWWWWVSGIHIHRDTDAPYNLHNNFSMWGTYWYCYSTTTDIWCYWASRILQSWVSNALAWVWANGSSTTAQRNAAIMTYTKDTFEYKIWQTLSSLTQTWTISLSASAQTAMESLFTDPDLRAYTNRWNNINPYQVKKVTVTYEPV